MVSLNLLDIKIYESIHYLCGAAMGKPYNNPLFEVEFFPP